MKRQLVLGILAAVISSAAPALASDNDREDRGGFGIGPLGQCFDARACGGAYYGAYPPGYYGYAYEPQPRYYQYPRYRGR
jgi:hypothetical protein